jgi:hypothetical protein
MERIRKRVQPQPDPNQAFLSGGIMADDNLIPFDSTKAPQKTISEEAPKREPITDPDELIRAVSGNHFTCEHIAKATGHIRELSMMLYEAQDSGQRCCDVSRAVQDLMGTYADEIDECAEYLFNLVKDASGIVKQSEKSGAE